MQSEINFEYYYGISQRFKNINLLIVNLKKSTDKLCKIESSYKFPCN